MNGRSNAYSDARARLNMLKISFRKDDGIGIVDLTGQLTLGVNHATLWEKLAPVLRRGPRNIIVNLRRVSEIDATGAGELKLLLGCVRNAGGNVVLLKPDDFAISAADALMLEAEFETFTDESDARNAFFPDRRVKRYDILVFATEENSG